MTRPVLPLLAPRDLTAPLAWRDGRPLSAGRFIADAQALAARLPARGAAVNLCQDRWHFALGLAAALLRGHTSLLPPNTLAETLRQTPADEGEPYALVDAGAPSTDSALPQVVVDDRPTGPPAQAVPNIPAAQRAACLLTSGSTGVPQPHTKHWGTLVATVAAGATRLAQLLGRDSLAGLTLVGTVPTQHSYGFESTVLLALLGGAAFDTGRPFYPADIAAALQRVPQPRALVSTPFHLKTLLRAGLALPPAELVLSATAPLPPQLAAQTEAAFGGPLVEIYGCTEAGQVATRRTTAGDLWTTLGDLNIHAEALPGTEPPQQRFVVGGDYLPQPTPLADVLVLQDERHFRLLGRANDLIHVAGKRSSLAHLNFHLNRIPGVEDGAFWLPDEVPGEVVRPVAFVVAPQLGAQDVVHALRQVLEPAFVPRRVVAVAALPREATGKLTSTALRSFALQTLASPSAPWAVPDEHPVFAGHFPGHPVLPGALLLGRVMQALAAQPALAATLGPQPGISNAKFLAAAGPGAEITVQLRPAAGSAHAVDFEVLDGPRLLARGQLAAGA